MSNLIVPDQCELLMLYTLGLEIFGTTHVKLFKNNYTPVPGSIFSNFTEADFTGYAHQALVMDLPVTVGGKAQCTNHAPLVYVQTGIATTNTIYGYYVCLDADTYGYGRLLWAERFDSAMAFDATGNQLNLTPVLTLRSEF